MSRMRSFRQVIMPQALRLALPGTATMGVDLLKSTSLLVTIAAGELMSQAQLIASETFRAMEVYLVIAAIYFAVCYPLSQLLLLLERKVRAGTPLTPGRRRRVRKTRALLAAGAARMSALIEIRDLSKSFGPATVLHSVDVEVQAGQILTILGQSGGGKSTLLRCINLLEIPSGGDITIAGDSRSSRTVGWSSRTSPGCGRRSGWSSRGSTCSHTSPPSRT